MAASSSRTSSSRGEKDQEHSDCESVNSVCSCGSSSGSCSLCESDPDEPLPNDWARAVDDGGHTYYWHRATRQTQWKRPSTTTPLMPYRRPAADERSAPASLSVAMESKSTKHVGSRHGEQHRTNPSHSQSFTTPPKSTTEDGPAEKAGKREAKRRFDQFRHALSECVVQCLMPYRRDDCRHGRIVSTDDFKHLARKLTHSIIDKYNRKTENLEVTDIVKGKTKETVRNYMKRYRGVYERT